LTSINKKLKSKKRWKIKQYLKTTLTILK
jgi:hypothetical protein